MVVGVVVVALGGVVMCIVEFLQKIFSFPYISLELSLTMSHKGKMLWCSYFRSFIKLTNFLRMGNFVEKFNFVSTS